MNARRATRHERPASPGSGTLPRVARRRTAVVVDDHDALREMIVEMLEHEDWDVRAFATVEEALPFTRATLPDIVLTDINVGVFSGAALARELRLDPATRNLTIVAMSGTTVPSPRMISLFDEFLVKPIEIARLDHTLRVAMARRHPTGR